MSKKNCFIVGCRSSTLITPNKIFLPVPRTNPRKGKWIELSGNVNRNEKSRLYCCEDHFDLKSDIINYDKFMEHGVQMRHSESLVPHKNLNLYSNQIGTKTKPFPVQNQTIGKILSKINSAQVKFITGKKANPIKIKNINEIVGNVQTQVKHPFNQTSSAQSQEICRLCLINNRNIRSIFNNNQINWVENDLSRQIFECANIKVSENDGATGICKVCLQEIISIIRFRKKCLESDIYLKSINCNGEYTNEEANEIESKALKLKKDNFITFINLGTDKRIITKQKSISEQSRVEINDADVHDLLIETIVTDIDLPSTAQNIIQSDQSTNYEIKSESSYENFEYKVEYLDSNFTKPSRSKRNSEKVLIKKQKLKEARLKRKLRLLEVSKDTEIYLGLDQDFTGGLCYICGLYTPKLTNHMLSHTSIRTDKCDLCERTFITPYALKVHRLTHNQRKIKCEQCDKKFPSTYHMKRHSRSVHRGYIFNCNICSKSFKTNPHLKLHSRIHTGEKRFNCELCDKSFTHSSTLKEHLKRIHSETTTKK